MSRRFIAILSFAAAAGLSPLTGRPGFFSASWPVTARAPSGEALTAFTGSPLARAKADGVWYSRAFVGRGGHTSDDITEQIRRKISLDLENRPGRPFSIEG